jgi:hypothetical protein
MIPRVSELPSQADDIDMVEVADGFIVYHPERDRVHFLNHTAAIVLTLCDGKKKDTEITALVQRCYELPRAPETEVSQCLEQFRKEGLVH